MYMRTICQDANNGCVCHYLSSRNSHESEISKGYRKEEELTERRDKRTQRRLSKCACGVAEFKYLKEPFYFFLLKMYSPGTGVGLHSCIIPTTM